MADFDFNSLNDLLTSANSQIGCGSDCQQQQESQQLETDYMNAEVNLKTAKNQLDTAQQNYITYTQGTSAYMQLQNNQLGKRAQEIVNTVNDKFNTEAKNVQYKISTYSGLLNNYNNIYELYLKYNDENIQLKKNVNNGNSDIATNDRKTYYETQEIELLNFIYKYVLLVIYIITVIGYCISVFFYNSSFNWKLKFAILLFLIVLPFISTWLLGMLVMLMYEVYNLLPKNVYPTL